MNTQLAPLVTAACPALTAIGGVGTETAAQLLISCGDNPDQMRVTPVTWVGGLG